MIDTTVCAAALQPIVEHTLWIFKSLNFIIDQAKTFKARIKIICQIMNNAQANP